MIWITGLLLGLASIVSKLGLLGIIFLIPFLGFLIKKEDVFKESFLFGFFYFGTIFIWLFHTLPLGWVGINNNVLGFLFILFLWFVISSFFAILISIFSVLFKKLQRNNWLDILTISFLWILFEWLRSFLFSIVLYGQGGLLGSYWTFGHIGYLLFYPINNLASFGGVYLLSFLFVFISSSIIYLKKKSILPILLILLFSTISLFIYNDKEEGLNIGIISTNFPSFFDISKDEMEARFLMKKQIVNNIKEYVDIILMPEDSRFLNNYIPEFSDPLIVDSSRNDNKSSVYYYDKDFYHLQNKTFLMPFGEYLPYLVSVPISLINNDWSIRYRDQREYEKGNQSNILRSNLGDFTITSCLEFLHPRFYNGGQIIFNMASHSFSKGSSILSNTTNQILKIRAIENKKYLIRSSNGSPAVVISPKGKIISEIDNGYKAVRVYKNNHKTIYSLFGDWILIIGVIYLILLKKIKNKV